MVGVHGGGTTRVMPKIMKIVFTVTQSAGMTGSVNAGILFRSDSL
jgi:hypothetical protein